MSIAVAILTVVGVAANVIGALCIIVPCFAWLSFMAWLILETSDA